MFGPLVDDGLRHVQSAGSIVAHSGRRLDVLLEEGLLPADFHFGLVDFRQTPPAIRNRNGHVLVNVLRVIRILPAVGPFHFRQQRLLFRMLGAPFRFRFRFRLLLLLLSVF